MSAPRERWVDIAKGIAITLVVFYHAVMFGSELGINQPWARINTALDTFRMPLFFFISGLMATRVVKLDYRTLFRRRILGLLYLYLVWCSAQWVFFRLLPPFTVDRRKPSLESLLSIFVVPNDNLWFIYALPLFFTVAWAIRRFPMGLQIGASALISASFGMGLWGPLPVSWSKTGRYFFFFVAAVHLSGWVMQVAPRVRGWQIVVAGALNVVVAGALLFEPIRKFPFALLLGGSVAVGFGIVFSVGLSRVAWFDWLRLLGTRTLPIYLVHTFPLALINAALLPVAAAVPTLIAWFLPFLLTGISILIALGAYRWLNQIPGIFGFPITSWVRPGQRVTLEEPPLDERSHRQGDRGPRVARPDRSAP